MNSTQQPSPCCTSKLIPSNLINRSRPGALGPKRVVLQGSLLLLLGAADASGFDAANVLEWRMWQNTTLFVGAPPTTNFHHGKEMSDAEAGGTQEQQEDKA